MSSSLGIRINDVDLDVNADTSMKLVFNNSLFDLEGIAGSYSYPFTLPYSAKNAQVFGFPAHLQSSVNLNTSHQGQITMSGNAVMDGYLKIKKVTRKTIEASFNVNISRLADVWRDKKINEFNYGTQTFYSEDELIQYMNNCTIDNNEYVFFPIRNEGIPSLPTYTNKIVNDWDVALQTFQFSFSPGFFFNTPYVFVRTVISRVCADAGIELDDQVFTIATEMGNLVIYNNQYIEAVCTDEMINSHTVTINMSDYLPDLTVGQFFTALKNMFNLSFSYVGNKLTIRYAKDILTSTEVIDWSNKLTSDYEIEQVLNDEGFEFTMKADQTDEYASEYAASAASEFVCKVGKANNQIETDASVFFNFHQYGPNYPGTLPWANQQLNNSVKHEPVISLRLLFYRGLHQNIDGNNYPVGSTVTYNDLDQEIAEIYLSWFSRTAANGIYLAGLIELFWQVWIDVMNSAKKLTAKMALTATDIMNLDFSKKIHIQGRNYLIFKVEANLPVKKLATVELVQVD